MTHYAEKEWDHFLHATEVGRVLDHFGQICGGVLSEAESTVKGFWNLNPARAFVDPKGFWHSVSGALEKLGTLTGADGEQKFEDSWKELGKDVLHWDEWSTNPLKAAGESAFDIGTLFVPGGALRNSLNSATSRQTSPRLPRGYACPRLAGCLTLRRTTTRRHGAIRRKAASRGPRRIQKARCHRMGLPTRRLRPKRRFQQQLPKHVAEPTDSRRAATLIGIRLTPRPSTPHTARASSCGPAHGGAPSGLSPQSPNARPSRTRCPHPAAIDDRRPIGAGRLHWSGARGPKRRVEEQHYGRIPTSSC